MGTAYGRFWLFKLLGLILRSDLNPALSNNLLILYTALSLLLISNNSSRGLFLQGQFIRALLSLERIRPCYRFVLTGAIPPQ